MSRTFKKPFPLLSEETPVFRFVAIKNKTNKAFRWKNGFETDDPRAGDILTPAEVKALRFMFDEEDVRFEPYTLLKENLAPESEPKR